MKYEMFKHSIEKDVSMKTADVTDPAAILAEMAEERQRLIDLFNSFDTALFPWEKRALISDAIVEIRNHYRTVKTRLLPLLANGNTDKIFLEQTYQTNRLADLLMDEIEKSILYPEMVENKFALLTASIKHYINQLMKLIPNKVDSAGQIHAPAQPPQLKTREASPIFFVKTR